MSTVQALEPGNRYDLRVGISPDAPEEDQIKDEEGDFGYCHSYESSSRYDGPGLRVVLRLGHPLLEVTERLGEQTERVIVRHGSSFGDADVSWGREARRPPCRTTTRTTRG